MKKDIEIQRKKEIPKLSYSFSILDKRLITVPIIKKQCFLLWRTDLNACKNVHMICYKNDFRGRGTISEKLTQHITLPKITSVSKFFLLHATKVCCVTRTLLSTAKKHLIMLYHFKIYLFFIN